MKVEVNVGKPGDAVLTYLLGTCPFVSLNPSYIYKHVTWSKKFCRKSRNGKTYVLEPPLNLCCRARTTRARRAISAAIVYGAKPKTIREAGKYLAKMKHAQEYGVVGYHTLAYKNKLMISPYKPSPEAEEEYTITIMELYTSSRKEYLFLIYSGSLSDNRFANRLDEKYSRRRVETEDDMLRVIHGVLHDYSRERRAYTRILALVPKNREMLALARLGYYFYRNPAKWKVLNELSYSTRLSIIEGTVQRMANRGRYNDKAIREYIHDTIVRRAGRIDKSELQLLTRLAGKGITLKKATRQTGKSNPRIDKKRKALPPGKRLSRTGKIYYEYRRNRSDLNNKR